MIYEVKWTFSATRSYFEEIDFIHQKWSIKEVVNFEKLVKMKYREFPELL